MNSFFANLFLQIQTRIQAQVPEIRFIEQNFGQYSFDNYRATVSFPAMLIDFPDTKYSAMQGSIQVATAVVNVVLLFDPFSQSYHLAPDAVKEKALAYYEIEQKVHMALHNWTADDTYTPLKRLETKSHNRNEIGLRIREINFSTDFEDHSLDNDTYVDVSIAFNGTII